MTLTTVTIISKNKRRGTCLPGDRFSSWVCPARPPPRKRRTGDPLL